MSMPKKSDLKRAVEETRCALGQALDIVEGTIPRTRPMREILAGVRRLRRKAENLGKPKRHPMKCVCGKRFRDFSTWRPHWRRRHPVLERRYSSLRGEKGRFARTNLMLQMMRAASA